MANLQRILLIEDDPDIQMVAQLSLEAVGGYKIEVASCGEDGLKKAAEFAPDLVLLDVMMPGMDGPTVLQRLRADSQTAHLPVVFMTAKAQAHEVEAYHEMGALGVITKPFDPMTLPQTVAQIWASQ